MVGLVSTATVTYAVVLNIADNATPADVVAQVRKKEPVDDSLSFNEYTQRTVGYVGVEYDD